MSGLIVLQSKKFWTFFFCLKTTLASTEKTVLGNIFCVPRKKKKNVTQVICHQGG